MKAQQEEEMEKKFLQLDRSSEIDKQTFLRDAQKLKLQIFDYQVFLGSDRAGRNYWLFESLPGLFLEHDIKFAGKCSDTPSDYNPGLANCSQAERNKYIRQMVIDKKNNDKENKAVNGLKSNNSASNKKEATVEPVVPAKIPSQFELFMCTTDPATCPVHSATASHVQWSFFHTEEEIDALINALNPRGFREKPLRENLELERELILSHIRECPVDRLVIEDPSKQLKAITDQTARKYPSPNYNFEDDAEIHTIFDTRMRRELLEFEFKLKAGYLGDIKVNDIQVWRDALLNFSYDQQAGSLQWGRDKRLTNGDIKLENGHAGEASSADGGDLNHSKESEESENAEDARYVGIKNDPGQSLGDKQVLESEDSQDDDLPLHESGTLTAKVQNLASALLQVEQGIDGKFIRYPFGKWAKHLKLILL